MRVGNPTVREGLGGLNNFKIQDSKGMQSSFPIVPESASTISGDVDALYFYISGITIFFTTLIGLIIIFFVIRYRRRNPFEIPRPIEGSTKLETLWSVIPLLIAMSIFVWGARVYFAQYRPPRNALEIYVVGKQWMWKFQHATGQREINELHVPVGRKIKLIMTTEDVIHDVFVPAFRIKADVVPGKYTSEWFEATRPGRYHFFCAEYCGMNHSGMGGWVEVMRPADFDNWLSGNLNQVSPATAGHGMFESLGCVSCHGQIEPMHKYGTTETLDKVKDGRDAVGLTCTTCHGGNPVPRTPVDPAGPAGSEMSLASGGRQPPDPGWIRGLTPPARQIGSRTPTCPFISPPGR